MIEDGLWSKTVGIIGLVVDVGTKRGWVERGVRNLKIQSLTKLIGSLELQVEPAF